MAIHCPIIIIMIIGNFTGNSQPSKECAYRIPSSLPIIHQPSTPPAELSWSSVKSWSSSEWQSSLLSKERVSSEATSSPSSRGGGGFTVVHFYVVLLQTFNCGQYKSLHTNQPTNHSTKIINNFLSAYISTCRTEKAVWRVLVFLLHLETSHYSTLASLPFYFIIVSSNIIQPEHCTLDHHVQTTLENKIKLSLVNREKEAVQWLLLFAVLLCIPWPNLCNLTELITQCGDSFHPPTHYSMNHLFKEKLEKLLNLNSL